MSEPRTVPAPQPYVTPPNLQPMRRASTSASCLSQPAKCRHALRLKPHEDPRIARTRDKASASVCYLQRSSRRYNSHWPHLSPSTASKPRPGARLTGSMSDTKRRPGCRPGIIHTTRDRVYSARRSATVPGQGRGESLERPRSTLGVAGCLHRRHPGAVGSVWHRLRQLGQGRHRSAPSEVGFSIPATEPAGATEQITVRTQVPVLTWCTPRPITMRTQLAKRPSWGAG
jgi:hypothetical protein